MERRRALTRPTNNTALCQAQRFGLGNLPRFVDSSVHSGEDVILTAAGPGSERVRGQLDNTEVFRIMVEALGLGDKN